MEFTFFFKKSKRILLCLIKEKILVVDQHISNSIKYKLENQPDLEEGNDSILYYYFYPELKLFIDYKN